MFCFLSAFLLQDIHMEVGHRAPAKNRWIRVDALHSLPRSSFFFRLLLLSVTCFFFLFLLSFARSVRHHIVQRRLYADFSNFFSTSRIRPHTYTNEFPERYTADSEENCCQSCATSSYASGPVSLRSGIVVNPPRFEKAGISSCSTDSFKQALEGGGGEEEWLIQTLL